MRDYHDRAGTDRTDQLKRYRQSYFAQATAYLSAGLGLVWSLPKTFLRFCWNLFIQKKISWRQVFHKICCQHVCRAKRMHSRGNCGHCGNYSKKKVVGRVGVEPTTLGLKVPCSTNWANDPTWRGKTPSKRNNHIMTATRLRECLIIFLQVAAFCAKNCRISSNMKITTHTPKRLPRFPPCRRPKPVLPSYTTPRRKNG